MDIFQSAVVLVLFAAFCVYLIVNMTNVRANKNVSDKQKKRVSFGFIAILIVVAIFIVACFLPK